MVVMISNSLKKETQGISVLNTYCMLGCQCTTEENTPHSVSLIPPSAFLCHSLHCFIPSFTSAVFSLLLLHPLDQSLSLSCVLLLSTLHVSYHLPLSLVCFVQPSGPSGVCFTPSFYAESCHVHVWTCQGGVDICTSRCSVADTCRDKDLAQSGGERLT